MPVPAAPTNLWLQSTPGHAIPNNTKLGFIWAHSLTEGITGYNVYRSLTSPVALDPGNKILTGLPPQSGYVAQSSTVYSFLDTGLTNGTQYFYVITAVNASGESAASAEIQGTPVNVTDGGTLVSTSLTGDIMYEGQPFTITAVYLNTGTSVWTRETQYKVLLAGTLSAAVNPGAQRLLLAADASIANGEEGTFTHDFTAPATGIYAYTVRLMQEVVSSISTTSSSNPATTVPVAVELANGDGSSTFMTPWNIQAMKAGAHTDIDCRGPNKVSNSYEVTETPTEIVDAFTPA